MDARFVLFDWTVVGLFLLKGLLFSYFYLHTLYFIPVVLASGSFLLIFLLVFGFLKRWKRPAFLIVYSLMSLLMCLDFFYVQFFNTLPSLSQLHLLGQLSAVSDTIGFAVEWHPLLFVADVPLLWLAFYLLRKSRAEAAEEAASGTINQEAAPSAYTRKSRRDRLSKRSRLASPFALAASHRKAATLLLVALIALTATLNHQRSDISISGLEFFSYHTRDARLTLFPLAQEVIDLTHLHQAQIPSGPHNNHWAAAEGKNLINIMIESFQTFVLEHEYDGQELTPFLNSLLREDTIYIPNYYQQLGRGNTSDAEFVSHNSLYPAMNGHTYTLYQDNTFYGLPVILRENGYRTAAFHGYKGDFWNRRAAYPAQGFEQFYSEENFKPGQVIGMGLNDKDFFKQSAAIIADLPQPFYAFMVTLTCHQPYIIPANLQEIKLRPEHEGTLFGEYLQAVRYTDRAIEQFVNALKAKGLYDNTVITIFGDHFGISSTRPGNQTLMSEYIGFHYDFDEAMRVPLIIHMPGSEVVERHQITGGQIDYMPTMLNLMGLTNTKGIMFGQDLLNAEEGFVAQQTYMLKGSFFTNTMAFKVSRDGIFANSRAWEIQTGQPLPLADARPYQERALREIRYSDYILATDYFATVEEIRQSEGLLIEPGAGRAAAGRSAVLPAGSQEVLSQEWESGQEQDLEQEQRQQQGQAITVSGGASGQATPQHLPYISHAAGRIHGLTYTNSLEALNQSYRLGHRLIEIDFEWTTDGNLALIHDWQWSVRRLFGKPDQAFSAEEFMSLEMTEGMTQMLIADLAAWMRNHPDAFIVSDVKTDNIKALAYIAEHFPDVVEQFVPQIYFFEQYQPVRQLGFENIILTLYLTDYTHDQVAGFAANNKLFSVTMPTERAKSELPQRLADKGVFTYAHTINDPELFRELQSYGVGGIYTDDLNPRS